MRNAGCRSDAARRRTRTGWAHLNFRVLRPSDRPISTWYLRHSTLSLAQTRSARCVSTIRGRKNPAFLRPAVSRERAFMPVRVVPNNSRHDDCIDIETRFRDSDNGRENAPRVASAIFPPTQIASHRHFGFQSNLDVCNVSSDARARTRVLQPGS